jgi:phosphonate transport system ATP-binding protein
MATSYQPLLSIKNLSKTYPNGTQALKGVSLDVKPGEFLVIIGLSGSGKSTLLRCVNRLLEPTSGQIFFQGKDITQIKGQKVRRLRANASMVFQHFNLIKRHTVLTNVLTGTLARTSTFKSLLGMFSKEDHERALECLDLVGLSDMAYRRADQLSGGQQQRVAIARALAQQPRLLLADEPVASLDPATCHSVMDYLEKVNRELGLTIICNLHFLSLVRRYAHRVIALSDGKVVYQGTPQDINQQWFERIYGEDAREVRVS